MRALPCTLALSLVAAPACSLVKLSDEITQGTCASHADCAVLNEQPPQGFPCLQWQCDFASGACAVEPLDLDDDGQSPAEVTIDGETFECEDDPARQDCEDADDRRLAGAPELCDDIDNDCDDRIDEGALRGEPQVLLTLGTGPVSDLSVARDAETGALALGYGIETTSTLPGLSVREGLDDRGPQTALAAANLTLDLQGERVALAALGDSAFALAFVNRARTERVTAGLTSSADAPEARFDPRIATYGVSCLPEESCAENAAEPASAIAAPASALPSLAASDTDVVLAYLRTAAEEAECGTLASASQAHRVLANLLVHVPAQGALRELDQGRQALAIAESGDLAPPALLALDADGPQWLIGYAARDGRGQVDRLRRAGQQLELAQSALLTLDEGSAPHAQLQLARGPARDDGFVLGSAYRSGCGRDARILLSLHELRLEDGEIEAEAVAMDVEVGGGRNASHPALAYSPARDAWLVAWLDAGGLRARVVTAQGEPRDPDADPYLLIANEREGSLDEVRVLLAPSALALDGDDWFGVLAQVFRAPGGDAPERAIEVVRMGCGD